MLIEIGVTSDEPSHDALTLGALLCRGLQAEPLLVHVCPTAYDYVSTGHVDVEWNMYLREEAHEVLADAAQWMAEEHGFANIRTAIHGYRSSGVGLNQVAVAEEASMIVIASAPGASEGRFQIGSTADQLLHGSDVPVALAPVGYRRSRPARIGSVFVAFQNTPESRDAVVRGAKLAETLGVPLVALTLLLRHRIRGARIGPGQADVVLTHQRDEAAAQQDRALAALPEGLGARGVIVVADSPLGALERVDWEGDEILVLSSSRGGKLLSVFLGDMTHKLIRATPVPAVVLPRQT